MTLQHLAELSALVALHGDDWIVLRSPISDPHLARYLSSCRIRQQGWRKAAQRITDGTPPQSQSRARGLLDLLAEVYVTEMLSRLWTAVLSAGDAWRGAVHAGPVAQHVLAVVLETRTQLLSRLVDGEALPIGTLLEADQIRRKFDRWTDLLIGELAVRHEVADFAVDPARAREFSEQSRGAMPEQAAVTHQLLSAGLRRAVADRMAAAETCSAHQEVVQAILMTLPGSPLDDDGRCRYPTGWPIRRAAPPKSNDLPPTVAARLQRDTVAPAAADSLAQLLRRLENQGPSEADAAPPAAS